MCVRACACVRASPPPGGPVAASLPLPCHFQTISTRFSLRLLFVDEQARRGSGQFIAINPAQGRPRHLLLLQRTRRQHINLIRMDGDALLSAPTAPRAAAAVSPTASPGCAGGADAVSDDKQPIAAPALAPQLPPAVLARWPLARTCASGDVASKPPGDDGRQRQRQRLHKEQPARPAAAAAAAAAEDEQLQLALALSLSAAEGESRRLARGEGP